MYDQTVFGPQTEWFYFLFFSRCLHIEIEQLYAIKSLCWKERCCLIIHTEHLRAAVSSWNKHLVSPIYTV